MYYDPDEECNKLIQRLKRLCMLKEVTWNVVAKRGGISNAALNELINGKTYAMMNIYEKSMK